MFQLKLANLITVLQPNSDPADWYIDYNGITEPTLGVSLNLTNNEAVLLYYKLTTAIVLATGSAAVFAPNAGTELGSVSPGNNANFPANYGQFTTAPNTDEIEVLTVTIARYTDSAYSVLYDSTNYSINVHMFSDALTSLSTVIETDDFAGGNEDGWNYVSTVVNSPYFNAASGYSIVMIVGNTPINKTFTISNAYTDAVVIFYIKLNNLIPVTITIGNNTGTITPPNTTNWFQICVKIPVNASTKIQFVLSTETNSAYVYVGEVMILGKLSGSF